MHSAATPPAGGRGPDGYGERAETYLRQLAEAALRPAADRNTGRVARAADVLVDAGVLSGQLAAQILADLQLALRVRGRREAFTAGLRLSRLTAFRPRWRVLPLGPPPAGSRLMALIRIADRAIAPAVLHFSPTPIALLDAGVPPLAALTATDDLGTRYRIGFPDGAWAGSTWTGTISLYPAPPPAARRLEITSPNGPVLRADIAAAPAGAAVPVMDLGSARESPGERLFTRRAEAMLAALAQAGQDGRGPRVLPGMAELTAVLEAAGVLSPLSAAPARVAALGQLLGLPMEGPASEVPARWMAVAAHYGRRRRPAPVTGTAAIGVVLPLLDGARFAVAGLHSGGPGSFLHVVAEGLRPLPRRPPPGLPWDPATSRETAVAIDAGFSWWLRDDAGGWHLGAIEEVSPLGGREGLLRMPLLPPLGHPAATLALEVSGPTQQVAATLPVRW